MMSEENLKLRIVWGSDVNSWEPLTLHAMCDSKNKICASIRHSPIVSAGRIVPWLLVPMCLVAIQGYWWSRYKATEMKYKPERTVVSDPIGRKARHLRARYM